MFNITGRKKTFSIRTARVTMKLQALVLFATLAAAVAQEFLQEEENRDANEEAEWDKFKVFCSFNFFFFFSNHLTCSFYRLQSRFKRRFKNKDRERIRKNTFIQHSRSIKKHNKAGKSTYKLQSNQFADWVRIFLFEFRYYLIVNKICFRGNKVRC